MLLRVNVVDAHLLVARRVESARIGGPCRGKEASRPTASFPQGSARDEFEVNDRRKATA